MRWISQTANDLDIEVIDLKDAFGALGFSTAELYLLPYDGHPSPFAYEVAASAVAETLTSRSKLAERCAE